MNHVLLGYGYTAKYLSCQLIEQGQSVIAYSRTKMPTPPKGLVHISQDLTTTGIKLTANDILYYFVPPSDPKDQLLANILGQLTTPPKKIIYCGSSGIYGDHQGQMVAESSNCFIETERQVARQSAENLIRQFAMHHQIPFVLCRVAGIYGPDRLPLNAVYHQEPVVHPAQAPLSNHIWVQDLSYILSLLGGQLEYSGVLNIADGTPLPMGQLQQQLAQLIHHPLAPTVDFSTVYHHSSPMKQEFLSQSKHLDIRRLADLLRPYHYHISSTQAGLLASLG